MLDNGGGDGVMSPGGDVCKDATLVFLVGCVLSVILS